MKKTILVVFPVAATLAVFLFWCGNPFKEAGPVFPGEQWKHKSPGEMGFDPARLDALAHYVEGAGCIIRKGYMVYSWGLHDNRADVASAMKPVIAHILYESIESGLIPDLDQRVVEVVPELEQLNADLGNKDSMITWRHLVTQTSCYGVSEPPGTAFDYNDHQITLLLDTLVLNIYRTNLEHATEAVLQSVVTDPLQCQDEPMLTDFGRLRISARDFARFGLLYLNHGKWKGRQLLNGDMAATAVSSPHPSSLPRTTQQMVERLPNQRSIGAGANQEAHMNSYSYCWWLNEVRENGERVLPDAPPDTYGAFGHAGRHGLVIIPSLDIVACWLIGFPDDRPWRFSVDGRKLVNEAVKRLMQAMSQSE